MKKKIFKGLILAVAAVALVVASVLGTIAYLTASSAVSNVFTVGNVSITMFESKVNSDGTVVSPKVEVDTNSYHLVPGATYVKDPTIRILSDFATPNGTPDKMYLFVKSRNQIREIEPGNATDATSETPKSMRQQMEDNGWVQLVKSGDGIEIIWVYGTRQSDGTIVPIAVDVNSNQGKGGLNGEFRLCESFTIASNADVSLYAAAKVNFTGFAIQSTGFTSAEAAWKAIMDTYPYEGGIAGAKNPYDATKDPYAPVPTTSTDSGNTDN